MTTTTVHVAVFDTLADWEIGYATAHIRSDVGMKGAAVGGAGLGRAA